MADMHKAPPLAQTLRGYITHAPANWRAHMAAAADAVEELSKLRAERDEARELLREVGQIPAYSYLRERIDAALRKTK